MKKIISLLLVICMNAALFSQEKYSVENTKVDSLITKRMQDMKIPGLAVAIIKDGKILKKSVYGIANIVPPLN